ncbi:MAG TPA: hypothetical protein VM940_11405 [Chthoniobacterales bacterium]|nr:hypothetical protein [Chthoniobacterales bacterium]
MMNPALNTEWPIKHRSDACARTERPFEPGEQFYTLLFREGDGFRREDISEEAWAQRNENIRPFSFWKSRYEPPPPIAPEPLAKENAEELLRRLLAENNPANANACYVLAVMLERKRVLKQVKDQQPEGSGVLIYEHAKTGDVFIVPAAELRLDQIEHVQEEVSQLLKRAS